MTTQVDPVEATTRARRALDDMSVNRDAMARDVIALTEEVTNWRAAFARAKATSADTSGGFAQAFGEIFKGFQK